MFHTPLPRQIRDDPMRQTSDSRHPRSVHASKVSWTLRLIDKKTRLRSTAARLTRTAVSLKERSQTKRRRDTLLQWRKININSTDQGLFWVPKITASNTKNPTKDEKSRISSSSTQSIGAVSRVSWTGVSLPSDGGYPERKFH
jgi:hypothetical protein